MNSPVIEQFAHHAALGAERRDERAQHDQPGIGHQLGHLADAADVLHPVGLGKAKIRFKPCRTLSPSSITVWMPRACRPASTRLAMVDLPAPGRPVNHSTAGRWCIRRDTFGLADRQVLMMDIGGPAQREIDHAGGDRFVRIAIDQDEGAGIAIVGIRIERDRPGDRKIADADSLRASVLAASFDSVLTSS